MVVDAGLILGVAGATQGTGAVAAHVTEVLVPSVTLIVKTAPL